MKLLNLIHIICEEMAQAARKDVLLITDENQILEVTPEYVNTFVQQLLEETEILADSGEISFIHRQSAENAINIACMIDVNQGWWVYFSGELDFADGRSEAEESGVWNGELRHFEDKADATDFYTAAKEMFTCVFLVNTEEGVISKYLGGSCLEE